MNKLPIFLLTTINDSPLWELPALSLHTRDFYFCFHSEHLSEYPPWTSCLLSSFGFFRKYPSVSVPWHNGASHWQHSGARIHSYLPFPQFKPLDPPRQVVEAAVPCAGNTITLSSLLCWISVAPGQIASVPEWYWPDGLAFLATKGHLKESKLMFSTCLWITQICRDLEILAKVNSIQFLCRKLQCTVHCSDYWIL